jgi:hypothetical protein
MKINKFELVDHGVEHEQYFQGCGVAFSEYDECYTGIGASLREALEDALEQIASNGHEISPELSAEVRNAENIDRVQPLLNEYAADNSLDVDTYAEQASLYYHASIRIKVSKQAETAE